ncbi:CopD family protein [Elstera cyanobacteriorum]|uniref:copper resistance CopC/CopD family protein n=1 Tax=Elstera cyanobacteriorum TaxID=2022747 RepID=UPI0023573414|nr:CopD family protein [Elstera cyanobacteriorum]MCK6441789.1 copper resistance protein CopC/CopD [Elstera cyanobacteriorum]
MIRFLLALLLLWVPLPALAHAGLIEVQPEDGARLETAPPEIMLRFNEAVTPISLRLIDSAGREQVLAPISAGDILRAALPAVLPTGAYTLSYRVTSVDAHPVVGAVVFGVGVSVEAGGDPAQMAGGGLVTTSMILRALANAATLMLAGGMLARLLLGPAAALQSLTGLALLAILGHGAGVWLQGGVLLGQGIVGLLSFEAWRLGSASTRGPSFVVLALGVALLTLAGRRREVILAGLVAVFGAYLLTGHAASAPPEGLAKPLLALHVAAAGFWIGALPILLRALTQPGAAALLARFSRWALGLVPLLVLAGVGLSLLQGLTPAALIDHPYGRLLALKLALVAGLLALAALNRVWLTPALAAGGSAQPLRRSIWAEGVLVIGVLLVTGVLSQTPPPRAEHHHDSAAKAEGFSSLTPLGDRLVLLALTPAQPGDNRLRVTVTDATGSVRPPLEAVAYLSLPAAGIENLRRPLAREGTDFAADIALPMAGVWQVQVDLLVTDFEKRSLLAEIAVR